MFTTNIIIAWRNLKKNKGFTALNIFGLATGMAVAIIILLWIQYEVKFDRFHPDLNRIYVAYNSDENNGKINVWNTTPKVMAKYIQQDFPEVQTTTRVNWEHNALLTVGDKRLKALGNPVDSTFFQTFQFPLIAGQPDQVLMQPNAIVITESLAYELFGDSTPIGKTVILHNEMPVQVSGIMKDLPENTSFRFRFLVPWAVFRTMGGDDEFWGNNSTTTYVLLKPGTNIDAFNKKLATLRKQYDSQSPNMETFLYPFSREYLFARFEDGKEAGGRIESIRLFGLIAAFVLLIACINFMNLSTARSEERAREVGIRKTMGAGRIKLITQFLGESMLLSVFSFLLAIALVWIILPVFNRIMGLSLELPFFNAVYWAVGLILVVITGFLAGSYPAFYLSGFRPVKVLKGKIHSGKTEFSARKVLVVLQFSIAIILITATIIVRNQINLAQQRNAGYNKDQLVYSFLEGDIEKNYSLIKRELLESGTAVSITKTGNPITENWSNTWGIGWEGRAATDKTLIDRFIADDKLVATTGLTLLQGRDFDLEKFPTDSSAVILNEAALKLMGFKNPIGQIIRDNDEDWHVIGVVKDFVVRSPFGNITPTVIFGANSWFNTMHIKLNPSRTTADNLKAMEGIFKKYNPSFPFEYHFVDEAYAQKFQNEKRTGKLAGWFAALTIIICCLGLFGLASYMAESRTKEIGIRKVLGASVSSITLHLSLGFVRLVIISFFIAAPIAWWVMHQWLQGFAYRIPIQVWMFVLAGITAVVIAFGTVGYQAIKAALANPIKSLRTE
jgi:putative ABC transport system permease protein